MFNLPQIVIKDLLTALDVGQSHMDDLVEAARTLEGRVDHVLHVGGGDDDEVVGLFEAVHLGEQLVGGLGLGGVVA